MLSYVIQNLRRNSRKYIVLFMMIVLSTAINLFTLEVISNLIGEMQIRSEDIVARNDMEKLIVLLVFGMILIFFFVLIIVHNIYSVLLMGRSREFTLLSRLGFTKRKIMQMLLAEITCTTFIASIVGILLEKSLSLTLIDKFDLLVHYPILICWILGYVAVQLIVLWGLVIKIYSEMNKQIKTKVKQESPDKDKRQFILGIFLIILGNILVISLDRKFEEDILRMCKYVLYMFGLWYIFDSSIERIFCFLENISVRCRWNAIYYAAKQNLYNIKKIKSIVSTFVVAVVFFVGFKGLYASIEKTTEKYVKDSVNYDYLVIFDDIDGLIDRDSVCENLSHEKYSEGRYSIALTLVLDNYVEDKKFALTLTGIEDSYYSMQKFYVTEESDINTIYDNTFLNVMYSSKATLEKGYSIGNVVNEFAFQGKNLPFTISAMYDPINLKQAFTSREALSIWMYGEKGKYNALYLDGYSETELEEIMSMFTGSKYEIYNMREYVQTCVDQAVNGTEMIDLLIYISLIFVFSLVINLLILSFGDRKRQYQQLRLLGEKRQTLLRSIIVESSMVAVMGIVIGIIIAIPAVEAMLIMMKQELIFDTVLFIPTDIICIVLGSLWICILGASYLIGSNCLKGTICISNEKE